MGNEFSNIRQSLESEVALNINQGAGKGFENSGTGKRSSVKRRSSRRSSISSIPPPRRSVSERCVSISDTQNDPLSQLPPKTFETKNFINESLQNNFLFKSLEDDEKELFIQLMSKECIQQDVEIIKQGEVGDFFYLVEEGEVVFIVDGKNMGTCSRGGCFGELSLLYSSPRTATCLTKASTTLWKIHHDEFKSMMTSKAYNEHFEIIDVLKSTPLLSEANEFNLKKLAEVMEVKEYGWGEQIVQKGDVADHFFIIKEGIIKIHNLATGGSDFSYQRLSKGDCFGGKSILMGERRRADATAVTNCTVLRVSLSDFKALVGNFENVIKVAFRKQILTAAPLFAKLLLKPREIDELVNLFEEKIYDADTTYTKVGDDITDPSFCIIGQGSATKIESNGVIATLERGDHFGGSTITSQGEKKSTFTIRFLERTRLDVLSKSSIESIIFCTSRLNDAKSFKVRFEHFKLNHFDLNRIIRKSDFGTVYFVTNTQTSKSYALNKISKKQIIEEKKIKNLIRTKNLLSSLHDFPFTVNLISTFQDPQNIYFLQDFVAGGELFSIIHKNNSTGRSPSEALFYASCVVLCLSHFYNHSICFRNLQPENILIDDKGYCVITDFGNAKIITDDKTFTFCGSPEYLAPEIILCKGHRFGVDHWALGVLLFELLTSITPFFSSDLDNVELFKRIVKVKYNFPENGKFTDETKDLINRLFVKKASKRLGYSKGVRGIKNHSYFNTIDWKELYFRKIKAPWIPIIDEDNEAGYFDIYSESEVQKSEDNITEDEQALFEELVSFEEL